MSEALNNKIKIVDEFFNGFTNFIELENFRSFLLLTLTSQGPMNIMAQLGLGGDKSIINLPYNPDFNIYYQKINLLSSSSLVLYTKSDPITKEFVLEKNDDIFKKFLSLNEIELAFRGKEKFLFPKISDCSVLGDSNLNIKIDDLFHNLESFISYAQPNILLVFDATESSKPDLLFTFNMTPQFPKKLDENVLQIDAYLDYENKTKNINYLKREEDYSLTYLKDIKEISNAELYKSSFSLILHIKSINKPF
ncbi:MAG TPA: hypothetical protein VMV43_03550 [Candidatus Nanopelagicaceae bacterium]|nr:hypothetical protein [Candidatus Nanopelagicaceae bacterium]